LPPSNDFETLNLRNAELLRLARPLLFQDRPSSLVTAAWSGDLMRHAMSDDLFGIHGKALAVRSQRMSMLAANIANAATPNYKARDLDFAAAIQLAETGKAVDSAVRYRMPVQSSLDGNTVELPTEQTAFAENAVQYRTTLAFLEGRIATITRALKGE